MHLFDLQAKRHGIKAKSNLHSKDLHVLISSNFTLELCDYSKCYPNFAMKTYSILVQVGFIDNGLSGYNLSLRTNNNNNGKFYIT